jgi:hypothetical protein
MIRIVLVNLLFLLLPLILYFAYVFLRQRNEPNDEILADAPIFWLLALGVIMMIGAIVFLGKWEGGDPDKTYVPPQYRDGVIVPGHYE